MEGIYMKISALFLIKAHVSTLQGRSLKELH